MESLDIGGSDSVWGASQATCITCAYGYCCGRASVGLASDARPKVQRGCRLDRNAKC